MSIYIEVFDVINTDFRVWVKQVEMLHFLQLVLDFNCGCRWLGVNKVGRSDGRWYVYLPSIDVP